MAEFTLVTDIDAPIERVFDLSRDIGFHLRSMAHSNERVVGGRTEGLIELGETVTWRARHFGIPFTMTSVITSMDPYSTFTDEQQKGPFASFVHVHDFTATSTGTRQVDTITFTSPLGPIGSLVNSVFLETYLHGLIHGRNDALKDEAEQAAD